MKIVYHNTSFYTPDHSGDYTFELVINSYKDKTYEYAI